ncbi:MAG TPA: hypothetical protein VEQ10_11055 [Vicinamibacteria bacterium]|nr:hypothetical protein [Vicinamibacteria bacterium]
MSHLDRPHRPGGPITDLCRACKAVRDHTVMAIDASGRALRVVCDFCGSQHHYRGGGEPEPVRPATPGAPAVPGPRLHVSRPPAERSVTAMSEEKGDLEALLRRVVREELGLTPGLPAAKWRGGEVVLRPGRPGLQEKSWPVDALFHKVVMIRNRLRTLEQQLNAAEIPEDLKLRLQAYVTACYGSLTSFNVLFAEEADQFKGGGGE